MKRFIEIKKASFIDVNRCILSMSILRKLVKDFSAFIIESDQWLNDDNIDKLGKLLNTSLAFNPRPQFFICYSQMVTPVPPNKEHIQMLFSYNDLHRTYANGRQLPIEGGYWVCSYYDGNRLYVYDSFKKKAAYTSPTIFAKVAPLLRFCSTRLGLVSMSGLAAK